MGAKAPNVKSLANIPNVVIDATKRSNAIDPIFPPQSTTREHAFDAAFKLNPILSTGFLLLCGVTLLSLLMWR